MIRIRAFPSLLFAAVVAGTTAVPRGSAAQEELADVIERCERSVIRIEVNGARGGSLGSGFVVTADGVFVTNVHVLRGASAAIAIFPSGEKHPVRGTLHIDEARDICIGRIDLQGHPVLPIAGELPRKGSTVTALGSPKGLSFTATTGIVSAIRPAEELGPDIGRPSIRGTWVQVDAALSGGNSGGPLINNRGEVVAMSTLASQGSAQNLNFGISAADIASAIRQAASASLIPLPEGVGKLVEEEPEEMAGEGGLIDRRPVPREKIEAYLAEARAQFKDLQKGIAREATRTTELMREMRKGETFLPPGAPAGVDIARAQSGRTVRYFFRSQAVKDREVSRLQARIRDLERLKESVRSPDDPQSMFELLRHYGPRLDPRRNNSVGFVTDAYVLHPFSDHDLIVSWEETEYLMWVESAAGLSPGQDIPAGPVFVAGTRQVETPNRPPVAVTVLTALTEAELRAAVFGSANAGAGQWRTWRDITGQYQIEATLVEVTATEVRLKKRDGSVISVPLDKLSPADLEFLGRK